MHSPLKKLLTMKGATVESVAPTATVQDAVVRMNEKGIGAVLVKDGTRPVGIFTERDVLKRVVALGRDAAHEPGLSRLNLRYPVFQVTTQCLGIREDLCESHACVLLRHERRHLKGIKIALDILDAVPHVARHGEAYGKPRPNDNDQ